MNKFLIAGLTVATSVAVATASAPSASAATPSWLHVHTATRATAYNNSTVRVAPSATISGQRVITSKAITVYRHGKRYRSGSAVNVPAGSYSSVTSGTYKVWALVSVRKTRQVLHVGNYANANCVVTQATDTGDGSTYSTAACTNSYYPGQTPTDDQIASYQVGDRYQASVLFDDQYVNQTYYVKARHYGVAHRFTSTKRSLTVRNGGFRRLYNGSGVETENSFRAPGSTWKISYSWNCSNFGYSGNMIITVYRSNGEYFDLAANQLAYSGTGRSYVHGSGRFYLEMDSECDWHVVVTR